MINVLCSKRPTSPGPRKMPVHIVVALVLILSLTPLAVHHMPIADAATWPYASLQAELDTTYATVQQAIAPLPTMNTPNHYIVPLYYADGNGGTGLIGTNGSFISYNVNRCILFLQALQRAGFNSTMVNVAWPLLDPTSNDPNLPYYQSFYRQVVHQAKAMGFWVVMSSGLAATGSVDYTQYRTIDTVFAGRRQQAWWIAQNLQPDWVISGTEPTTDKQLLSRIPDVSRFTPTYWGAHFAALMQGKPSGTRTKYGGGASPHDHQAFADAAISSPLDGFDSHPFPLTNALLPPGWQYWNKMFKRFDQAHAAGKAVLVTQTSPWKESAAEVAQGRLTANDIYLRDMWNGFQPQDQAFMAMWQQITLKKGLTATTYWWANRTFFGGYIPYDPRLRYHDAATTVDNAAYANLLNSDYKINAEGQLWVSFVKVSVPSTATPTQTVRPSVTRTSVPTRTATTTPRPTRTATSTPPPTRTATGTATSTPDPTTIPTRTATSTPDPTTIPTLTPQP